MTERAAFLKPPLQDLPHPLTLSAGLKLQMLRLDLIHPEAGGNKWFKLKYNLEAMRKQGHNTLLTFGGAFSNHIAATAAAGRIFGFKTIGIIRGEELSAQSNTVLAGAERDGMLLRFVTREEYRRKREAGFLAELSSEFGSFYHLPEGGSNEEGVRGCEEIMENIPAPDFVICACGTGATLAGIARSLKPPCRVIGIPALADSGFLEQDIERMTPGSRLWQLFHGYDFGRYGCITPELNRFIDEFKIITGINLDPVYTAKMMYGLFDLVKKGFFVRGERLIALHTVRPGIS